MKALVFFSDDNTHPLAFMLRRGCRHVWCAVYDDRTRMWVEYNTGAFGHDLRVACDGDFDLSRYYEDQGVEVFAIDTGDPSIHLPYTLNNCVGVVKSVLGLSSWALTPSQLRRHIKRLPVGDLACPSYALD